MRPLKAQLPAILLVLLAAQMASAADRLVLISPHADEIQNEFETAFKRAYLEDTGREVDVEWLDIGGGTPPILRYIKSEFGRTPEGIGIDLFFGGGVDPYLELVERGLLAPYRLPEEMLERLPQRIGGIPLYDPGHRWYGATLSGFGIAHNITIHEKRTEFQYVN